MYECGNWKSKCQRFVLYLGNLNRYVCFIEYILREVKNGQMKWNKTCSKTFFIPCGYKIFLSKFFFITKTNDQYTMTKT